MLNVYLTFYKEIIDASPKMLENYCELIVDQKGINALLINYTFLKKWMLFKIFIDKNYQINKYM